MAASDVRWQLEDEQAAVLEEAHEVGHGRLDGPVIAHVLQNDVGVDEVECLSTEILDRNFIGTLYCLLVFFYIYRHYTELFIIVCSFV